MHIVTVLINSLEATFLTISSNVKVPLEVRRQRGSVPRVGDLNAGDLGSNSGLGLLNNFVLGDPRGKFPSFEIAKWFASYQLGFFRRSGLNSCR